MFVGAIERGDSLEYNGYFIPANYTDSGKLFGLFEIRNAIEAVILSLPILYLAFVLTPADLTWKIISSLTFTVPKGGFALIGIYDDCLTRFIKSWFSWSRNRKILLYKGDADGS